MEVGMIDIAVGVLQQDNKVCLSLRQKHQSHAGHWEFPGGKVESSESIAEALVREFQEELAIETTNWQPLIEIPWHYEKVSLRLHVYSTQNFVGKPVGNEGQLVKWFSLDELSKLTFPEANQGILTALNLADKYMISGSFTDQEQAQDKLSRAIQQGIRFCQLRAKDLTDAEFMTIARPAIKLCQQHDAKLLLNGDVTLLKHLPQADGIQLASNRIYDFTQRPISKDKLLGVSTHTEEDIEQALKIDADFILLSPVKETQTHPGVAGMGWQKFSETVTQIPIPVYALGGMKTEDVDMAKQHGGQGVAAISAFWPS